MPSQAAGRNARTPRILRAGLSRLVLYREDTGGVIDCSARVLAAGSAVLSDDRDRVVTAAGTYRETGRTRALPAVITDREVTERLEAWEQAGVLVKGLAIGMASSAHVVWDQAVPFTVRPAHVAYPGLVGHVVELQTARFEASVGVSDDLDLFGLWQDLDADGVADGWTASGDGTTAFRGRGHTGWQTLTAGAGETQSIYRTVTLPAPGLEVALRSFLTGGAGGQLLVDDPTDDSTVELILTASPYRKVVQAEGPTLTAEDRQATYSATAEGEQEVRLVLPPRTFRLRMEIRVTGGTAGLSPVVLREPRLFTRPRSTLAVLNGGFLDGGVTTPGSFDVQTVTPFGTGTLQARAETRTFKGTDYAVEIAELGPDALAELITTTEADRPYSLTVDLTETP